MSSFRRLKEQLQKKKQQELASSDEEEYSQYEKRYQDHS